MKNQVFLQQIRNGNAKSAFRHLYAAYPSFKRWVKSKRGYSDDASDVFQDALLLMHKKCMDNEFNLTSAPKTYLLSVAKFLYFNKMRSTPNFIDLEYANDYASHSELSEILDKEKQYEILDSALSQIGEKCMKLLHAFYHLNESMELIAQKLDFRNAEVAKAMKYKCLERARKIVSPITQTHEASRKN